MARPFYRTSGFKCTPTFDVVNSYLWFSSYNSKIQGIPCGFKMKIKKFAYGLEKSRYFIVSFLCLVKKEYFF